METELAVERIKQYRSYVLRVVELHNDIDYLAQQSAPHNNLTAQFDANKGGYIPPARPDAIRILNLLNFKRLRIIELEKLAARIERALALLPEEERLVIIMKYVDNWHVNLIAEHFGYASRQSVYSLLKRSVTNFSHFLRTNA